MRLSDYYEPGQKDLKYKAVADAVGRALEEGLYAPGDMLPTQRALAAEIGVTIGTVTRGYEEAALRGLVTGVPGRGTFAAVRRENVDVPGPCGRGLVNLGFVGTFEHLDPNLGDALSRIAPERLALLGRYHEPAGLPEHREAGAAWARRFGVPATGQDTLVCAGGQHALHCVLSGLFKPGDRIACEELSYPLLKKLCERLRIGIVPVRMDRAGMDAEALEAACRHGTLRGVYLMPTCHNPTLCLMPESRRRDIADVARRHGLEIVEDDVFTVTHEGRIPPLSALVPERSTFIAPTSAAMGGGLRVGYVCTHPEGTPAVADAIAYTVSMAPPLMAEIARLWIEDGTAARVLGEKRTEAGSRSALARAVLDGFSLETRATGFFAWLRLPRPWSGQAFAERLRASGVVVAEAERFLYGRKVPVDGVRISLGGVEETRVLEEALGRIAGLLL